MFQVGCEEWRRDFNVSAEFIPLFSLVEKVNATVFYNVL